MPIDDYCEELDSALSAADTGIPDLEEIHGFMTALLCGPHELSFKGCVCALFLPDDEDSETGEYELPEALVALLSRLYDDTQRSIGNGSFLPIVACDSEEGGDVDARGWCHGFLMGMERNRAQWGLDDNRVLDLLTPIILLADPGEFEQAVGQVNDISALEFKQELMEELPGSVCALKNFFKKKTRPGRPPGLASSAGKRRSGKGPKRQIS